MKNMKYDETSIINKQKQIRSSIGKLKSKSKLGFIRLLFFLGILLICTGFCAATGMLKGLVDAAPSIDTIDVSPKGYATTVYDAGGHETHKLVGSDANRIYVNLDKIPLHVQNAFIAIEDARFWEHNGIDMRGIFRAALTSFSEEKGMTQGASTITQQLLKNQVFDGGNETTFTDKFKRKIQEQYLAIQLENKLSKQEILEYYLNTINLGQNTLGVQAASNRYFDKDVSDLTISEAAVIAGITQNPTQYNPITHPEDNAKKRSVILSYMKEQGYIDESQYNEAVEDDVYSRIADTNTSITSSESITSYFEDALIEQLVEDMKNELGYSETQAYNTIYRGGLKIYTTQEKALQKICDSVINNNDYYPETTTWSLSYQLTIETAEGEIKNYSEQTLKNYFCEADSDFDIFFGSKGDAKAKVKEYKKEVIGEGDTIISENISYVAQPQVSFVLMEQSTGKVKAIVGGRGKKSANRTLNRATDSLRQPGSTFKILSTYLPALDTAGMTLATVQDDAPYDYPGTDTPVHNWTGDSYYKGLTSLREAIYNSMNIVTVKTFDQVTPQVGFDYLTNLGFTSLIDSMTDKNGNVFSDISLPTALGGLTNGVSNLELTAAFASIANAGCYTEPTFYTKVIAHDGTVLLEKEPSTRQVMKESSAYLLTDAMEDVVTQGTGTITQFDEIYMPSAGKTGTTSNDVDIWFVGFTPYYTAGIWGGYDKNTSQSNTTYHKYIWREIMQEVHKKEKLEYKEFPKPDSIVTAQICTKCGNLATEGLCDNAVGGSCVKEEIFAKGSVPTSFCTCHQEYIVCTDSDMLATDGCPKSRVEKRVYLVKEPQKDGENEEETSHTYTADNELMAPESLTKSSCKKHKGRKTRKDTDAEITSDSSPD